MPYAPKGQVWFPQRCLQLSGLPLVWPHLLTTSPPPRPWLLAVSAMKVAKSLAWLRSYSVMFSNLY